jgi:hypothetical protein
MAKVQAETAHGQIPEDSDVAPLQGHFSATEGFST